MADMNVRLAIDFRVPSRVVRWGLASILCVGFVQDLSSESVILSTYYPAPSGVYQRMITTQGTALARDGGNVTIGPIGGGATATLDVGGGVRVRGAERVDGLMTIGPGTVGSTQQLDVGGNVRFRGNERIDGNMSLGPAPNPFPAAPNGVNTTNAFVNDVRISSGRWLSQPTAQCNWSGTKCHCFDDRGGDNGVIVIGTQCQNGVLSESRIIYFRVTSQNISCNGSYSGCNTVSHDG